MSSARTYRPPAKLCALVTKQPMMADECVPIVFGKMESKGKPCSGVPFGPTWISGRKRWWRSRNSHHDALESLPCAVCGWNDAHRQQNSATSSVEKWAVSKFTFKFKFTWTKTRGSFAPRGGSTHTCGIDYYVKPCNNLRRMPHDAVRNQIIDRHCTEVGPISIYEEGHKPRWQRSMIDVQSMCMAGNGSFHQHVYDGMYQCVCWC